MEDSNSHPPEDALGACAAEVENFLRQHCLDPGQDAVGVAVLLQQHDVIQSVHEHGRVEDGLLQHVEATLAARWLYL